MASDDILHILHHFRVSSSDVEGSAAKYLGGICCFRLGIGSYFAKHSAELVWRNGRQMVLGSVNQLK